MFRMAGVGILCLAFIPGAITAQSVPDIDPRVSRIEDFGADLRIELALSRPVLWRVFTLDQPRRLVVEFDGLNPDGAGLEHIIDSDCVEAVAAEEAAEPGWFRVVMTLTLPLRIETAGIAETESGAALKLQLAPTSAAEFARSAGPLAAVPESQAPTRVSLDIAP